MSNMIPKRRMGRTLTTEIRKLVGGQSLNDIRGSRSPNIGAPHGS